MFSGRRADAVIVTDFVVMFEILDEAISELQPQYFG